MERTTPRKRVGIEVIPVPTEYKVGRPTNYHKGMDSRIYDLACLGLTIAEMARAIGISTIMLQRYFQKHVTLRESYEEGRWIFDHAVQLKLQQRAVGYEYEEVKEVEGVDALGRDYHYTVRSRKHMPADNTSMIFWLKNRHKDKWRDVYRVDHQNDVNISLNKTMNLNVLTQEQRELVRGIALKQIENMHGVSGE